MEKIKQTLNNVTNVMEQNIRGVQMGCYSVALVGLTIAIRKVRPFSKFKRPSDIPKHFIEEKRELSGLVARIEPSGGLLMVQHKPLINLPIIPTGELPVKISGVKVSGLGLTWLQAVVVGTEVKFIPVAKDKDFVQCKVLLLQTYKDCSANCLCSRYTKSRIIDVHQRKKQCLGKEYSNELDFFGVSYERFLRQKKKQEQTRVINVGENLLKIGFGTREDIGKPLIEDPSFLQYYKTLQKAEAYAWRKELGYKYYLIPGKFVLKFLLKQLSALAVLAQKGLYNAPTKLPKLYSA